MKNIIGNEGFVSSLGSAGSELEILNQSVLFSGSLNVSGSTQLSGEFAVDGIAGKEYPFKNLWDDLQGTVSDGNVGAGNTALTLEQYRDTGFLMYFFRHDQNDILNIVYQMTHMWDPTTAVRPHAHVIPMGSVDGNLYFSYQYAWVPANDVLGAITSWTSGNVTIPILGADQYIHKIVSFGNISPPETAGPSSMLLFKMTRLGTNPLDTYTSNKSGGTAAANLGVLYLDLHYQKTKAGTLTPIYY